MRSGLAITSICWCRFSVVDANQEGQYAVVPFNRDLVDELIAAGMDPEEAVAQSHWRCHERSG